MPLTSLESGIDRRVLPDLVLYTNQIVNLFLVGDRESWVLVDAGMPNSHEEIAGVASDQFGDNAHPKAIILTHGHFDHVGSILHLVERWQCPVYAHERELPYLNGTSDYPPADPTVNGGLVTELARFFPHRGIDLGKWLMPLPPNGEVPDMPGWRWKHTPGHSPGHVSLFREADRTLIAGDAFVTVRQESLYRVFTQDKEINGPPKYFTTDWEAAERSVRLLRDLHPSLAVTGHGRPMAGDELTAALNELSDRFREIAVPSQGRYVD